MPKAWATGEPLATQWKVAFGALQLWAVGQGPKIGQNDEFLGWVPITWPSYVVQLRWNLLLATSHWMGNFRKKLPLVDMGSS